MGRSFVDCRAFVGNQAFGDIQAPEGIQTLVGY